MKKLAPIVLFVYNRPWHTKQTIEALQKNKLAKKSELFIYSDEAKNEDDKKNVDEVRRYIENINGFKNVTIIKREKNLGLADSIIDGVTTVVNKFGRVIVLEDDLVTSPYFLKFMNEALEFYKSEDKVMHISGCTFSADLKDCEHTFFLKYMFCWGWATWESSWKYYKKDSQYYIENFTKDMIFDFNLSGMYDAFNQILDNYNKKINTWAVFWGATIYLQKGLCLQPKNSYVKNIGCDDSGVHCGATDAFDTDLEKKYINNFTNVMEESKNGRLAYENFFALLLSKRFADEDYKKLRLSEENKKISVKFFGKKIKTLSATKLLLSNIEIFDMEIYKYKSKRKNPLIIDFGADVGLSIIYFKMLYLGSKIIAFEQDEKKDKCLKYNIESFDYKDINLVSKNLSKRANIIKTIPKNKKIDFIKIDMHGLEIDILENLKYHLNHTENICVKFDALNNKKQNLNFILDILGKHGFRYRIEYGKKKASHIKSMHGKFDNIIYIFGYRK